MGHPALEICSLTKRYRTGWFRPGREVLRGLELRLEPGAAMGLVGPNGSGKSTLLRILAGVERPTAGSARVFGAGAHERSARRRTGYLPDGFPFPLELGPRTVLDVLGSLHGLARRDRRRGAEELLERVGLSAEGRTPLGRFSLGMRRRFALCTALLHGPDLLLLDEPTAGLDAPGYVAQDELLREVQARGAALLMATHVVSDLQDHCQQSGVLIGGRVAQSGPTQDLLGDRAQLLALYRKLANTAPCSD